MQLEDVARRAVLLATLPCRLDEDQPRALEAVADDGQEQLALGAEELEEVRLGDADASGDGLRGGPLIAAGGEFGQCRAHDLGATVVGRLAGRRGGGRSVACR